MLVTNKSANARREPRKSSVKCWEEENGAFSKCFPGLAGRSPVKMRETRRASRKTIKSLPVPEDQFGRYFLLLKKIILGFIKIKKVYNKSITSQLCLPLEYI
jgi:hypothetical protein